MLLPLVFATLVLVTSYPSKLSASTCQEAHRVADSLNLCESSGLEVVEIPLTEHLNRKGYLEPLPQMNDRQVVLTFDDGPSARGTTECIRQILRRCEVRAHFFQVVRSAVNPANLAVSKRLHEDGHFLGMHTYDHKIMMREAARSGLSQVIDYQIQGHAYDLYSKFLGEVVYGDKDRPLHSPFFRYAGGSGHNEPRLHDYLTANNLVSFYWDMMAYDAGTCSTGDCVYRRIEAQLRGGRGGILLAHDSKAWTMMALPRVLDYLHRHKYQVVIYTDPRYLAERGDLASKGFAQVMRERSVLVTSQ